MIANLRTGDCFLFDHELAECCAAQDAVDAGAGVFVVYEAGCEVRSRVFDASVEVDLISRGKMFPRDSRSGRRFPAIRSTPSATKGASSV